MVRFFYILLALTCSLAVFVGSEHYFSEYIIESKHQLVLQGFFPVDCELAVFAEDDGGERTVVEHIRIDGRGPHVDQRFTVNLHGEFMSRLGLEFTTEETLQENTGIYLHFVDIINSFTEDVRFLHTEIRPNFVSSQFDANEVNRLNFDQSNAQITLVSKKLSNPPNSLFSLALPVFLSLLALVFLLQNNLADLPAFKDMNNGQEMTNTAEFNVINGVRGLSALLVLFSHTAPGFASLNMGLALLFVLSGFLLTKPFVLQKKNIFEVGTLFTYLIKRSKRILPMYYFTVFLLYLVSFEFDTAARHFLFVEARGHLWAIPQILTFYMLLPILLVLTSLTHRLNRFLPIILLLGVIGVWKYYLPFPKLFYNGSYHTPFMCDAFLLGVAISYLQYGLVKPSKRMQDLLESGSVLLSIAALITTVLAIAWSAPVEPPDKIAHIIARFDVKCILAAAIILFAVNTPHSFFAKLIGNQLFRSVGVIGFSFYLLHGLGIQMVLEFQETVLGHTSLVYRSWVLALSVLVLTYIASLFTYSFIERPFFGKKKD